MAQRTSVHDLDLDLLMNPEAFYSDTSNRPQIIASPDTADIVSCTQLRRMNVFSHSLLGGVFSATSLTFLSMRTRIKISLPLQLAPGAIVGALYAWNYNEAMRKFGIDSNPRETV